MTLLTKKEIKLVLIYKSHSISRKLSTLKSKTPGYRVGMLLNILLNKNELLWNNNKLSV